VNRATYYLNADGYEIWQSRFGEETDSLRVHQLLAIANGTSPYGVFGGLHIHHKNDVPWDNRPSNLEVLTHSEHSTRHAEDRWEDSPWRDEETLHRLYVEGGMSERQVADELECARDTARYWINRYDLEQDNTLPCGHTGFKNLGGGEYTCSTESCEVRYSRGEVAEVFG